MAKTRMSDGQYCYYYLEDGECSLDNPVVWSRLRSCVNRIIRFTGWIRFKNFAAPGDILAATKVALKDNPVRNYGDENTLPISRLIKAINTQVGREYWKYLKESQPYEFERLRAMQRVLNRNRSQREDGKKYPRSYDCVKDKNRHKKLRDEVSDHYILGLVYNNLKYQTGIKYTFDEIREKYPFLIQKKKAEILKKRGL